MQINFSNQTPVQNNKTSFKAKIKFVDKKTFNALLKTMPDSFEVGKVTNKHWTIEEAALVKPSAFTLEAYNCVVGSIFNPKTKLTNMFHISPYEEDIIKIDEIADNIFKQAKILKGNSKTKLEGFICGGESFECSEPDERLLLNIIHEIFDKISRKLGMNYSTISGRTYDSNLNLISDAQKNTHFVYLDHPRFKSITNRYQLDVSHDKKMLSPKDSIILTNKDGIEKEYKELKKFSLK